MKIGRRLIGFAIFACFASFVTLIIAVVLQLQGSPFGLGFLFQSLLWGCFGMLSGRVGQLFQEQTERIDSLELKLNEMSKSKS